MASAILRGREGKVPSFSQNWNCVRTSLNRMARAPTERKEEFALGSIVPFFSLKEKERMKNEIRTYIELIRYGRRIKRFGNAQKPGTVWNLEP